MRQETVEQTMWLQQRFNATVGQARKVSLWVRGMKTILTTNLGGIRAAPSCLRYFRGHSSQPRPEARKADLVCRQVRCKNQWNRPLLPSAGGTRLNRKTKQLIGMFNTV